MNPKIKNILYRIALWGGISLVTILLLGITFIYTFKDKIITASILEINKHLNAKIDIDPAIELSFLEKFPQVSLTFKKVKIYEGIPNSKKLLGEAEKLYFTFNIKNILDGNYLINQVYLENGSFHLIDYENGENNYSIFKSNDNETTSSGIDLTNISIKNTLVIYDNLRNHQYYEILSRELSARFTIDNNLYSIMLSGPQKVKTIRVHGQDYFKEKELTINSRLQYNDNEKKLTILPTSCLVSQSEFNIEGSYVFKSENLVDLKILNKGGEFKDLLSLLPKEYAESFIQYKSEGEVYFNSTIKGIISDTENAAIRVNFGTKNTSFYHPELKQKITNANITGTFTNGESHTAKESKITLDNINFVFDNKLIKGNFSYYNFENPSIAFDAMGSFHIASLLNFYKINSLKTAAGSIDFNVNFKGQLNDLKTKDGHSKIEAGGEITLNNLSFELTSNPIKIMNTSGLFIFNKNDVAVSDFTTKIGKSDFAINGLLKNLFGAFFLSQGRLLAEIDIQSANCDIEELLSFQSTQKDTENTDEKSSTFPYLEKYFLKFNLEAMAINYKKVDLKKLMGKFTYDQPLLKLEEVKFQIANGTVELSSLTQFKSEDLIETTISSTLSTLDIDKLMYMFDDFGQTFITNKNLKGSFTGGIETALNWNSQGEINTNSIVSNIDCSIVNGELIGFEPMQNLAKFIDANELNHILFSELKNKFFIENRKISFPEMKILSNVSDISIYGTHTFDNDMDYKLSVPLKNLKKPKIDKDAAFGAIEEDNSKGSTLFLTIKGNVENSKISYDTKRTKSKINDDLKKEKQEFLNIFRKKEEQIQETIKPNQEEFFEFED